MENGNELTVELLRYPGPEDWLRCKNLALNTVWKETDKPPDEAWKKGILRAEHSPIRTLMFTVKMNIPYYVSVHFCRHKYGVEHYVTTQRNDRQDKYDRNEARQDAPVVHTMDMNAQALLTMARRRLCGQADPQTRKVMRVIALEVMDKCPEFEGLLIPTCLYRGGCPEFQSCGYYEKAVERALP